MAVKFNITNLKKHLGTGLGLRKNKYLLEIPTPVLSGEVTNVLCQSAGLPERVISTVDVWHKGRKYNVKGITDYGGEYEVSIVSDSEMKMREMFDNWMRIIDDSRPDPNVISGASYENEKLVDFNEIRPSTDENKSAEYQVDINIWQLDSNGLKVYGYKLENAFPKQMGIVTLEDDEENSLSQFSVTFAYSEFVPLRNKELDNQRSNIGGGSDIPSVPNSSSASKSATPSKQYSKSSIPSI